MRRWACRGAPPRAARVYYVRLIVCAFVYFLLVSLIEVDWCLSLLALLYGLCRCMFRCVILLSCFAYYYQYLILGIIIIINSSSSSSSSTSIIIIICITMITSITIRIV